MEARKGGKGWDSVLRDCGLSRAGETRPWPSSHLGSRNRAFRYRHPPPPPPPPPPPKKGISSFVSIPIRSPKNLAQNHKISPAGKTPLLPREALCSSKTAQPIDSRITTKTLTPPLPPPPPPPPPHSTPYTPPLLLSPSLPRTLFPIPPPTVDQGTCSKHSVLNTQHPTLTGTTPHHTTPSTMGAGCGGEVGEKEGGGRKGGTDVMGGWVGG